MTAADTEHKSSDETLGIDRAALVFAATAGAVTLSTASGEWGPFSTFIGVMLTVMVMAFHKSMSGPGRARRALSRLAFGLTISLCLLTTAAWPLSVTGIDVFSGWSMGLWTLLALLLTACEARIVTWLDR